MMSRIRWTFSSVESREGIFDGSKKVGMEAYSAFSQKQSFTVYGHSLSPPLISSPVGEMGDKVEL